MSKFGDKMRAKKEERFNKKQERKKKRQDIKKSTGKTGVEQAIDKVKNTKLGKVVSKVAKTINKGRDTNLYKLYKGTKDTITNLKKGRVGEAVRTISSTSKSLNKKEKNKEKKK
tara:strand:+ start:3963 stop:4304 length:342 start_codon:yes stop_codon:yes gene_type:complete